MGADGWILTGANLYEPTTSQIEGRERIEEVVQSVEAGMTEEAIRLFLKKYKDWKTI